jgi:hypothetical protein
VANYRGDQNGTRSRVACILTPGKSGDSNSHKMVWKPPRPLILIFNPSLKTPPEVRIPKSFLTSPLPLVSADVHKLVIATAKLVIFHQRYYAVVTTIGSFKASLIKTSEH